MNIFPTFKALNAWADSYPDITDEPRLVTAKKDGVYYYFQQVDDVYKEIMTSLHDVNKEKI